MYTHIAELPIEKVIEAILHERPILFNDRLVSTSGARLRTFLKGTKCVTCGKQITHCFIDGRINHIKKGVEEPHINFYHIIGEKEILMTSDHIRPKSKGGAGGVKNRQPMCFPCNSKKGNKMV